MNKYYLCALALCLSPIFVHCGTGTHSNLRPADTIKTGTLEAEGGISFSGGGLSGEGLPVGQLSYGILDTLEINAISNIKDSLIGPRWSVLSTKKHGIALSLGLMLGSIQDLSKPNQSRPEINYLYDSSTAWASQIILGRKFENFEPYATYRAYFTFPNSTYQVGLIGLGARFDKLSQALPEWPPNTFVTVEGGTSQQRAYYHGNSVRWQYEASLSLGITY